MNNIKFSENPEYPKYPNDDTNNINDCLPLEQDFAMVVVKKEVSEITDIDELRDVTLHCIEQCFLLKRLNDLLQNRVNAIDFFEIV